MSLKDKKDKKDIKGFKVIIVGNASVGKSTLLVRFIDNYFNPQVPTVGLDLRTKKINKDGQNFNLQIWDSAGQQRYKAIVFSYIKNSKAACVVFDITNLQSLEDCRFWFKQLGLNCSQNIPKVLIGTKSDLLKDVPNKEQHLEKVNTLIKQYQAQFQAKYFQASSLNGNNVKEIFDFLFQELYRNYKANSKDQQDESIKLRPKTLKPQPKNQGCCK